MKRTDTCATRTRRWRSVWHGSRPAGETPCVVLSTASPYKFPCDVLGALGADVPEDEFEAMRLLQEKTGVPAPASLAGLREKPVRFTQVVEKDGIRAAALAL